MKEQSKSRRKDPIVLAIGRLITATDRLLTAASQLRLARIDLEKAVEKRKTM